MCADGAPAGRRLAVFVGSVTAPNVRRLLSNFATLVPGTHHLVTTTSAYRDLPFALFGTDQQSTVRGSARALSAYLRDHDPAAVVQVTRPPTHGTVAGLVARRHSVPFVYRYSGDRFYEYRVARGRDRLAAVAIGSCLGRVPLRLADRHVALGPTGRRRLLARGVPRERTAVLPPAVDLDRFADAAPAELDVPPDVPLALFVGRLNHLKGADTLASALPRVVERRSDLHVALVGPRERRLDHPRARDRVTYVDPVPPDEIPGLLRAADVLVHPSLTEGVPRAVLEALADLEDLPLDDVTPFPVDALAPRYREFFESFR